MGPWKGCDAFPVDRGNNIEKLAKSEIPNYARPTNNYTASRELLCAVFGNFTLHRGPVLEMLAENMQILGPFCDFAVFSYKCQTGTIHMFEEMAYEANTTLALYRCSDNSNMRNKYLQKSVLFNRLFDILRLYRKVWILEEDVSFESFSPDFFFKSALCSFSNQLPPIIFQPTIFTSLYKDNYLYYGHWKGSNDNSSDPVLAAAVGYVDFQMPIMNSLFFEWFVRHVMNPFLEMHSSGHRNFAFLEDELYSHLLCKSAGHFAKALYGDNVGPAIPLDRRFDAATYQPCIITTSDNTSVYHHETSLFWNRPLNVKLNRANELLMDAFPAFYNKVYFERGGYLNVVNSSRISDQCLLPPAFDRRQRQRVLAQQQRINKALWRVPNTNDIKNEDEMARMYYVREVVTRWLDAANAKQSRSKQQPAVLSKLYAVYFPQFHRDKLNDKLWGEGFTDWDTLAASAGINSLQQSLARPFPLRSLGYYDLTRKSARHFQAALAKSHGVDGFIYHHYYFYEPGLGASLHAPLEQLLIDDQPDLPFALHWANLNWTVTWQGESAGAHASELGRLLQQQYCPPVSDPAVKEHYAFLRRFFRHRNYILVNGVPLFLLYRYDDVGCQQIVAELRRLAMADGFPSPGLHVTQKRKNVEHEIAQDWSRAEQKRGIAKHDLSEEEVASVVSMTNGAQLPMFDADFYYPGAHTMTAQVVPKHCFQGTSGNETRPAYLSVVTSFDNTPRRGAADASIWDRNWENKKGRIILPGPLSFERDLVDTMFYEMCCQRPGIRSRGAAFVAINAWNEWAEGMVLEPSLKYGVTYLEAVGRAKRIARTINCDSNELAKYLELLMSKRP
jgi:hypothetical protein